MWLNVFAETFDIIFELWELVCGTYVTCSCASLVGLKFRAEALGFGLIGIRFEVWGSGFWVYRDEVLDLRLWVLGALGVALRSEVLGLLLLGFRVSGWALGFPGWCSNCF